MPGDDMLCFIHAVLSLYLRFLLARHKAAIEVYNEAEKMSSNDWVQKISDATH